MPKKIKSRVVQVTPRLEQALDAQRALFRQKFGRDPGPDDPILFDQDADTPQPLKPEVLAKMVERLRQAMEEIGTDVGLIHAARVTDRVVPPSEAGFNAMSEDDRRAWLWAVAEGRKLHADSSRCRCEPPDSALQNIQ